MTHHPWQWLMVLQASASKASNKASSVGSPAFSGVRFGRFSFGILQPFSHLFVCLFVCLFKGGISTDRMVLREREEKERKKKKKSNCIPILRALIVSPPINTPINTCFTTLFLLTVWCSRGTAHLQVQRKTMAPFCTVSVAFETLCSRGGNASRTIPVVGSPTAGWETGMFQNFVLPNNNSIGQYQILSMHPGHPPTAGGRRSNQSAASPHWTKFPLFHQEQQYTPNPSGKRKSSTQPLPGSAASTTKLKLTVPW